MISDFQLSASCLSAVTEVIRQMETVFGRVRIQKTAYFLKRQGLRELDEVEFFYHHYGPFSWTVAESLNDGVRCNALQEEAKPLEDDRQAYAYRVTKEADTQVDDVSPASRALVGRTVTLLRKEHWRTLELASTIDYLEQREGLGRTDAVSRALGLKPACRDYQAPALRLLEQLALPSSASGRALQR
jgi:uncharacterized protein YwgA